MSSINSNNFVFVNMSELDSIDGLAETLIQLNQKLLDCIAAGDFETYKKLCHSKLTCFEPEVCF
jgi:regulator of sigma D